MANEELQQAVKDDTVTPLYSAEYWSEEMELAEKRLERFHSKGDRIVERYLDYRTSENRKEGPEFRLNLFHTNVSMLQAMLYGRIPEVNVARKWQDANDDTSRIASEIFNRLLNTSVEDPGANFGDVLRACLQDRLLPGHGIARVRYEFQSEDTPNPDYDPEGEEDPFQNAETYEDIINEEAPIDYVHWRDFVWGYGRLWADLPWIAYRAYMTRKEVGETFGEEFKDKVEYSKQKVAKEGVLANVERGSVNEAEILEIWCKESGKVYFWSKGCDTLLKELNDPLNLKGFFPSPQPMIANLTTTLYRPTSDWQISQDLYNEIDLLQTRISIITKAIKVVGVYDQGEEGVKRMLQEGVENDLIPVDSWGAFAEKGGIKGVVDWYPVQDIVQVLTTLEQVRGNTIQLLYEVTGMSDILRGAAGPDRESAQSATARTRFASIRVQHLQDDFARFASDLMNLRAQVVSNHWEPETIVAKSNVEKLYDDPQDVQKAVEMIKQQPSFWPWRIDIKAESIAMIDYAQIQSERTEFLTVMGTYVQSMTGLIQYAPEAAPLLMEMMKWGLAGFKGAQQIEGLVDKMIEFTLKELQKPKKDPEADKNQAKMAEIQAKSKAKQQELAMKQMGEMKKLQAEFQAEMATMKGEADLAAFKEKTQAHYGMMETMAKAHADARVKLLEAELKIAMDSTSE